MTNRCRADQRGWTYPCRSAGSGQLRYTQSAKDAKKAAAKRQKLTAISTASAGTSGLASSLAFESAQGIELANPNAAAERAAKAAAGNETYFSASGAFTQVGDTSRGNGLLL